MNHLRRPIGLIVAALAATIAFHPTLEVQATEQQRVVVEIRKFKFVPETLVVRPGDVVVWRNMDIVPHTATSRDDGWDSDTIEAGGECETVVSQDMRGAYYCRFVPQWSPPLIFNPNDEPDILDLIWITLPPPPRRSRHVATGNRFEASLRDTVRR